MLIAAAVWIAMGGIAASGQDSRSAAAPANLPAPGSHAQVVLAFDRPGLLVPRFQLTIFDDATGVYQGEESPPTEGQRSAAQPPQEFRRTLNISRANAARIFALAQQANRFNITCAYSGKNLADTGNKTLSYAGPDGSGSCAYNFTENKGVDELTSILRAIAETMDTGRELDRLHRYDRLGLDAAMESLAQEVAGGRALELGTIAPSLRSIAADTDVLQRVRMRTSVLLNQVPLDTADR